MALPMYLVSKSYITFILAGNPKYFDIGIGFGLPDILFGTFSKSLYLADEPLFCEQFASVGRYSGRVFVLLVFSPGKMTPSHLRFIMAVD